MSSFSLLPVAASATAKPAADASVSIDRQATAAAAAGAPVSEVPQRTLMLLAGVLSHARLSASATSFVTELAACYGCSRVTLGFVRRGCVEVVAVSNGGNEALVGEDFDGLAAAMDEAVQQGHSIHLPMASHGRSLIRNAHARWLQRHGGTLASIPLLHASEVAGAISCEWSTPRGDVPTLVDQLESVVSLVGPVLHLMHQRDLPIAQRWSQALRRGARQLRAPESNRLRAGVAGAVLLGLALCLLPADYQVGGRARIEGEQQRALVAAADGFLKVAHVRPGDRVKLGQVLIEMAEQDMTLDRQKWTSELGQQESAYATALSRADRPAMVIALARAEQARAQLGMIDGELARARIVAPFDGVVIQGDLAQAVGSPVERGKPLMLIAPSDRHRIVVEVDERDIAEVQVGQPGALSLSALPWERLPIRVTRVTPIAKAVEGNNVFEVETDVVAEAGRIRPGLEGVAKITVGRRSLAWGWTHRAVDRLRIRVWSWWGG